MKLKKENNLSSDTQLVNGLPKIQTQIQLVRAMDRNKIVMKSENWPDSSFLKCLFLGFLEFFNG